MYCPLTSAKGAERSGFEVAGSFAESFALRGLATSRNGAELIVGYVARTLDAETEAEFRRHLELCCACREAVAAQQAVWSALDAWRAILVSPDFDNRLLRRIAQEERGGRWRPGWPQWRWRPAVPVAAACILLACAFLLQSPAPKLAEQAQARPKLEIEQVEHALDDIDLLRQLGVEAVSAKASPSAKI